MWEFRWNKYIKTAVAFASAKISVRLLFHSSAIVRFWTMPSHPNDYVLIIDKMNHRWSLAPVTENELYHEIANIIAEEYIDERILNWSFDPHKE